MTNTDYKTGWTITAWIESKSDTTYAYYSDFKDKATGKKLDKVSLFVSKTNFKHRGNDTDELICYNRESTPEKYSKVWERYDEEVESAKEEIRQISKKYNIKVSIR